MTEVTEPSSEAERKNKLDGRAPGEWKSRYPRRAWVQISFEFGYLVVVLGFGVAILGWIGYVVGPPRSLDSRASSLLGLAIEYPRDRLFLLWLAVGVSGVVGGACFALKYLYHAVAKWEWNVDRFLWRIIVPPLSGTVAVVVAMSVSSGVVALIDARFFSSFFGAVGAGWLIGYFSDHVLAALQRLAQRWFGTVDEPKHIHPDPAPAPTTSGGSTLEGSHTTDRGAA